MKETQEADNDVQFMFVRSGLRGFANGMIQSAH